MYFYTYGVLIFISIIVHSSSILKKPHYSFTDVVLLEDACYPSLHTVTIVGYEPSVCLSEFIRHFCRFFQTFRRVEVAVGFGNEPFADKLCIVVGGSKGKKLGFFFSGVST